MRKNSIIIFCVSIGFGVFVSRNSLGQGTIYVSNLGQPSAGGLSVASDSWYAGAFFTGTNGGTYLLNSVQLKMTGVTGNPNNFTVTIHTNRTFAAVIPGGSIGQLVGSSDPASPGIYTYVPALPIILGPGIAEAYFIVVTADTPVATGAYGWSTTSSSSYNTRDGWLGGLAFHSNNGSSWVGGDGVFAQFAVNATGIPEPSALLLFGCSLLTAARVLSRKVKAS